MHLLPCPSCQTPITVSPSQAGDQTKCPSCDQNVAIPKLGDLRQLPLAETDHPLTRTADGRGDASHLRRTGFLVLGLIAIAGLLIASYCGIRWLIIDVPTTTAEHLAEIEATYRKVPPAHMIREYEDMDRFDISMFQPYTYKKIGLEKSAWGRNTAISGAIAGFSILAAFALAVTGRNKRRDVVTDT